MSFNDRESGPSPDDSDSNESERDDLAIDDIADILNEHYDPNHGIRSYKVGYSPQQQQALRDNLLDEINVMFDYVRSSGIALSESQQSSLNELYSGNVEFDVATDLHAQLSSLIKPVTPISLRSTSINGGWRVNNPVNNFLIWATVVSLSLYILTSVALTVVTQKLPVPVEAVSDISTTPGEAR